MELWGTRVVLAATDAGTADLVRAALAPSGVEVIAENEPGRALTTILGVVPNVVLVDAASPDFAAGHVVRMLRTMGPERGGRIPVVAIGSPDQVAAHRCNFQGSVSTARAEELLAVVAPLAHVEVERRTTRASWRQGSGGVTRDRRWRPAAECSA